MKPEYQDGLAQALQGVPGASPFNFGKTARDINIRTATNADGSHIYTIRDSGGSGVSAAGASLDTSHMTLSISGAGVGATTGNFGVKSLSTRTTGSGAGSYVKTVQSSELPEEYRHFVPAE